MSLGKILSNTMFREQVQRTFILHRDLRSCLSLTQAEKLVNERQAQIRQYGKTALLEFLNNFPLNYSYKVLSSPLKLFLFSAQLKDLSTYEEQLRYNVLSKLKEYICIAEKPRIQELINQSEKALLNIIKTKPFDTTHAINYLLLQKDSRNNQLFYHCLNIIKKTEYHLFKTLMYRTIPIFVKRIGLDDWSIIRNFDYLIEALTFDFIPKDIMVISYPFILQKIAQLQLHTVCYHKIPPAIDFIIGYFMKHLQGNRDLETSKLQIILKAFENLPMGYNEKAFSLFLNKLFQKAELQQVRFDLLPYRHLTQLQINHIFLKFNKKNFSINQMVFNGNIYMLRKAYLETKLPEDLYVEFMKSVVTNRKNFLNSLVTATILLQYYKNDTNALEQIKKKTKQLMVWYHNDYDLNSFSKFMSISNIFHFMRLQSEIKMGNFQNCIKKFTNDILLRSNNEDFRQLKFLDNIIQSVILYADSPIPQIRNIILQLILNITKKSDRFFFRKYSELIFRLGKSQYSSQYKIIVTQILKLIKKQDCPYLVELFNRFPSKSLKMSLDFIGYVKNIDSSFSSIGKLMVTSSYTHFTTSRGELNYQFRKIIESIEPNLSVQSFKGYQLPQLTFIIKFCIRFYYYISEFSRKLLMLSLNYIQTLDHKKQNGKFLLNYIQEAISLKLISSSTEVITQSILAQIKKLRDSFPQSLMMKIKEVQFRWLLGMTDSEDRLSLLVQQVLSDLSSENYSQKHTDVMIILLKLNSLDVINLKKIVQNKLSQLIINGLENNTIKIADITNQLYLPFNKGGSYIEKTNANSIGKIIIMCLDKIGSKQNFEYYIRIIEFGNYIRNTDLIQKSLNCMTEVHVSPSQIKRIITVIRFHRKIEITKFAHKLLKQTLYFFDYLRNDCAEILFCVHLSKNQVSKQQHDLTKQILKKNLMFLNDSLGKHGYTPAVLLNLIVKHLWVCLKLNILTVQMQPLFKYAIDNHNETKSQKNKGNFHGIPTQNVAYIYGSIIKFIQLESPIMIQKLKQQENKTLFKNNTLPAQFNSILQDNRQLFDYLSKFYTQQQQVTLAQYLTKSGLKVKTNDNANEDNIFELNKTINGVNLNGWVRKNKISYGIVYINERYLTTHKNPKGRVNFTCNSLSIITGLKVVPFFLGKELQLE